MPLIWYNEIFPITHNPNLTMREKKKQNQKNPDCVALNKMTDQYFSKLSRSSEAGQIWEMATDKRRVNTIVVRSSSHFRLFVTPWTAAHQASLSFTVSQSLLKLMSIESVMPSNHLILCRSLLLLSSVFPSIRVLSCESALRIRRPKYWSFSFSISPSKNI